MSNPVLNNAVIKNYVGQENALEVMEMSGVVLKTFFMFSVILLTSFYMFSLVFQGFFDKVNLFQNVGMIGGLITAFVITFSKNSKIIAPLSILYSVFEGLFIGGISAYLAVKLGTSLVFNAVFATFGVLFVMLFLYSTKVIKCTEKFRGTILASTFGVLVIYLVSILVSLFNPQASSFLMSNSPVGIGFSLLVSAIAAFNLIVDFDTIERAKNAGVGKDFEWYGAFSLMVTLIWLYVEILNLLVKLNSRNN